MSATTERRAWILGTTAPALIFLLVIAYLPIAYAVMLSFFKKTAFNPAMKWVGLANYRYILEVWGLVSALLLNRAFRGLNFVRSLFVLPYLLPSIVVALIFQWLLSQEYGVVNQILMQTGVVARPINFFGGLATAMWAVIGMAGWQYGSFATLLILARLQAINPKLYEAAAVSGAGTLRAFWDVTLPNLRTTLIVIALLRGIWMFNKFDSIWLVTHGGPLKGAAGGRRRLLQAVRPHEGDRGGAVSRLQLYGPFALLLVVLVFVAFPFYWMVLTSFTPREALFRPPYRFFRLDFSLGNYRELLFATEFVRYFANSLIAAVGAIVLNVVAATLAGYGLTRFAFPCKKTFAFGTLFSYMFPPMLMAIPLYILFSALQMRNTYTGLILAHMAISLPLNIWLMWQYFQIVPQSLEEAAWVSGASRLRALRQVCLPSARPGILSVAIFSFALSWNDFTFAFLLQTDRKMFTLPVGLATFVEQTGVHWGMVMAAAVLVSVPTFLLVFFLQRYLLSGLRTAG